MVSTLQYLCAILSSFSEARNCLLQEQQHKFEIVYCWLQIIFSPKKVRADYLSTIVPPHIRIERNLNWFWSSMSKPHIGLRPTFSTHCSSWEAVVLCSTCVPKDGYQCESLSELFSLIDLISLLANVLSRDPYGPCFSHFNLTVTQLTGHPMYTCCNC